jgi:hypothetical protein
MPRHLLRPDAENHKAHQGLRKTFQSDWNKLLMLLMCCHELPVLSFLSLVSASEREQAVHGHRITLHNNP